MQRKRTTLSVTVIVVMSVLYMGLAVFPETVMATTRYVGGLGAGNYTTVQSAVDAADPGDTVYVFNGTYSERITITKSLTLTGERRASTIINGGWAGDVIYVSASWVNISGFTIRNGGSESDDAGIELRYYSNCRIHDNIVSNNGQGMRLTNTDRSDTILSNNVVAGNYQWGIFVGWADNNTTISNNLVLNNAGGIRLSFSDNNTVFDNNVSNNGGDGIMFRGYNNTVVNNTVFNNEGYGLYIGGSNHTIDNNNISMNAQYDVYFRSSSHSSLSNNSIASLSDTSIHIGGSDNITVFDNEASSVIALHSSEHIDIAGSVMAEGGIWIGGGNSIEHWNTHNIDTSNVVMGKPIYYWRNVIGGMIPLDAGQVILANSTGVLVENLNLTRVRTGVELGFSSNNTVSSNTVMFCRDGIQLWYSERNIIDNNFASENNVGMELWWSNHNVVSNNTVYNNEHGLVFYFSSNNTIVHNNASRAYLSDIWLLYTGGNEISNNNIVSENWSIRIDNSFDSVVSNNSIWSDRQGILIDRSRYISVANNTILGGGFDISGDMREHWNTHIIDVSNTVNGRPVRYWKNITVGFIPLDAGQVILANCTGVVVENQNEYNTSIGILLGFSNGNTISRNIVSRSDEGMGLFNSAGNYISNNTVSDNSFGIGLGGSTHNSLCTSNSVFNNSVGNNGEGIGLGRCDNCTVVNNTVYLSNEHGIDLYYSENITIAGNNILDNENGIRVSKSHDNRIYHNNIIRNVKQGYNHLTPNINQWDDGYPSGGNYWDDYTGVDVKRGPAQDMPGSDGWGDTPYAIDADSRDRYPSMFPFGYPPTPEILRSTLTGNDLENVTIEWSLSPDDGAGLRTVVGYRIFRNATYNFRGLHYESIATLPNGTTSFVDIQAGEGDPSNYFYQVCAVDVANRTACPRTQAGKFTKSLSNGLNLVSIPLKQSDEDINTVFQTVVWEEAWMYDSNASRWDSHMKSKPYLGALKSVSRHEGIWLNVTKDSNLTVAGLVLFETAIQLRSGWNLVGFPSFGLNLSVGDLKNVTRATHVEGFAASTPPYFLKRLPDSETLEAGNGYWIHLESDTTWIIRNS
ncbi:MAG: right-handed parallel beta-helix repeat-containing protein [Thermoplasmata archaeon]|nr:right-handed parallel beta-helix repeat-containing protein [Thermoplasmata archaeon]